MYIPERQGKMEKWFITVMTFLFLALLTIIVMPSSDTSEYDLADQGTYLCREEWDWFFTNKVKDCARLK